MRPKQIITTFALAIITTMAIAQNSFNKAELKINILFQHLKQDTIDTSKQLVNDSICDELANLLMRPASLDYDFATINGLRKLRAPNGKVAVYTWCYARTDGTLAFNGFIQHKTKKGIKVHPLQVKNQPYTPEEDAIIPLDNWYGAAYFDIYPFRTKKGTAYILLGWAQNKRYITMKTMDVLWFDENGQGHLGLPIWQILKKEFLSRIVMQYNEDVSTTLLYEPQNKRFVFDHLVPVNSGMVGQYQYYAPDSSYDAYKKKTLQKCWEYQQNVEVE